MQGLALGLLLAMAAVFVVSFALQQHYPWLSYVRAASEGGMVGPLAAVDNPQVAWMVLLAAPGVPIAQMLEASARHWPPRKA